MEKVQKYVLITPAKNEASYIGLCIESLLHQTLKPHRWIIISDGSEDETDILIQNFALYHDFIQFVRKPKTQKRSFSAKAAAFRYGFERLLTRNYDFIGNLDADVTLPQSYYEEIIRRMEQDQSLGIAGGVILDKHGTSFQRTVSNSIHVPGAVQLYRRECFEQVGGYPVVTVAGEDSLAVLSARSKGWKTRSFEDLPVHHHKPAGSGTSSSLLSTRYKDGMTDYYIGTHPLFALFKCLRRVKERPFLIGALVRCCAYFQLFIRRVKPDASKELVAFIHTEQMARLKQWFLTRGKSM